MKVLLFDIEGTTTDINFVHKVLFPYATERIAEYVRKNPEHPAVHEVMAQLPTPTIDGAIALLLAWIAEDKKIGALKTLQGDIWTEGYKSGAFKGHVYPDVRPAWEDWKKQGLKLAIYSSGSVTAQKLIFGHSENGDLTPLLSAYFDTKVGAKREFKSYQTIAEELKVPAADVTFFSDIKEELDAARAAGMKTIHLFRSGTVPTDHTSTSTFAGLQF